MNARRLLGTLAAFLLFFLLPGRGAALDPAELVPARTLAYLELHQPRRLVQEIRGLLKGSDLEDPIRLFARQAQGQRTEPAVGAFLTAFSPEVLSELGDCEGGALALTGLTPKEDPELVWVLLTGKSRMLTLGLRFLVGGSGTARCIDRIEGVPLFHLREEERGRLTTGSTALGRRGDECLPLAVCLVGRHDEPSPPADKKPEYGSFYALLPGAIVGGTTPQGVADAVRRLKGKSAGPALAGEADFREAAARRDRPGLFAYVDLAALSRTIDGAQARQLERRLTELKQSARGWQEQEGTTEERKKEYAHRLAGDLRDAREQHRRETRGWKHFQVLANPAGVRFLTAGWALDQEAFSWTVEARMRDGRTSSLFEMLSNRPPDTGLLRFVPRDSFAVASLSLADGPRQYQAFLRLLEACHAAGGENGPAPTRALRALEARQGLRLDRDLFPRIKGLAWTCAVAATGPDLDLAPHLIVQAVDEAAAREVEKLVPRLYGMVEEEIEPTDRRVEGQVIHSFVDEDGPSQAELPGHYGRRGDVLVFGWDRRRVAAALRGADSPDLADHPRALAALRGAGPASGSALVSGRQFLAPLTRLLAHRENQTPEQVRTLNYVREMSTPMAAMPPTRFTLRRLPDGFRFEMRQDELRVASATFFDMIAAWALDESACDALGGNRFRLDNGPPARRYAPPPGATH